MIIYKLTSSKTDQVYVGKTVQKLNCRLNGHTSDYYCWLKDTKDNHFCSSYFIAEYDDVKIEEIEETNNSLREIYWIRKLNCCNFEFNGDNYFIYKHFDKKLRLGYRWLFKIILKHKKIVYKYSHDLNYLIKFRDNWLENNQYLFIE